MAAAEGGTGIVIKLTGAPTGEVTGTTFSNL
jgi:hypothetical protein